MKTNKVQRSTKMIHMLAIIKASCTSRADRPKDDVNSFDLKQVQHSKYARLWNRIARAQGEREASIIVVQHNQHHNHQHYRRLQWRKCGRNFRGTRGRIRKAWFGGLGQGVDSEGYPSSSARLKTKEYYVPRGVIFLT